MKPYHGLGNVPMVETYRYQYSNAFCRIKASASMYIVETIICKEPDATAEIKQLLIALAFLD